MSISLEQKLAIHEMLSRAAYAYDERDVPMLDACFADHASFSMRIARGDLIGPFEGREAIMGLMTGSMEEQTDVRRHVVSNIFFDESANVTTVISNRFFPDLIASVPSKRNGWVQAVPRSDPFSFTEAMPTSSTRLSCSQTRFPASGVKSKVVL